MCNRELIIRQNVKRRYKMYRAGKRWLFAGILFMGTGATLLMGGNVVQADTNSRESTTTEAMQVVPSDDVKVPEVKSVESQSKTNDDQLSDSQLTTPQEEKMQAVAESESGSEQSSQAEDAQTESTAVESAAPSASQQNISGSSGTSVSIDGNPVTVDKSNFEQYFQLHNATYDGNGTVTLTNPNDPNRKMTSGSITLSTKIRLDQSFELQGKINLGSHDQQHGGGDGIAFGFHDANSGTVGAGGAGLGVGGIPDAIGWKADTTYNWEWSNDALRDPVELAAGTEPGAGYGNGPAFGAFITTAKETDSSDPTIVDPGQIAGDVTTIGDTIQLINPPFTNDGQNGVFENIDISYNADDNGRKTLTVSYEDKKWVKDITDWAADKTDTAFFVSAATASNSNLQQFQLDSFVFQAAATVDIKCVAADDATSAALLENPNATVLPANVQDIEGVVATPVYPSGAFVGKAYSASAPDIKGYTYIRLYQNSLNENGTLSKPGNNGTVIYLYAKNGNYASEQKVNILYWDKTTDKQLGQTVVKRGESGSPLGYSYTSIIDMYKSIGYNYDESQNSQFTDFKFDSDSKNDQTIKVYFTHRTMTISLNQTYTRIIRYVKASDKSEINPATIQTIPVHRTGLIDFVTYTTTFDPWPSAPSASETAEQKAQWPELNTFDASNSPVIPGFKPDNSVIPALEINMQEAKPADNPLIETVTYTPVPATLTVTYVDDTTGEKVTSDLVSGFTGTTGEYTVKVPTGYILAKNQAKKLNYTLTIDDTDNQIVHLTHEITYGESTTTRTITYVVYGSMPAPETVRQTVKWTVTTDKVTGATLAVPQNIYTEITSPRLVGYTPDQAIVPQEGLDAKVIKAAADLTDENVTVTYAPAPVAAELQVTYVERGAQGASDKLLETEMITGKVGDDGDYIVHVPADLVGEYESLGLIPGAGIPYRLTSSANGIVIYLHRVGGTTPGNPTTPDGSDTGTPESPLQLTAGKTSAKVNAKTLPETGNAVGTSLAFLGISLLSLLGLAECKRKIEH